LAEIKEMSPVPIHLLRAALCLLAIFFAFWLARVATRLRRLELPLTKALSWVLRLAVTLLGVLWSGGLDFFGILALALAAAGFALGVWVELRPRNTEEIHIAPPE
jgi:hypothetical protein